MKTDVRVKMPIKAVIPVTIVTSSSMAETGRREKKLVWGECRNGNDEELERNKARVFSIKFMFVLKGKKEEQLSSNQHNPRE